MSQLFKLVFPVAGTLDPLLVLEGGFDGFDLPQTSTTVLVLSDGSSLLNEVLQQGASPAARADVAGVCVTFEDAAILRAAFASKEAGVFTDSNGNDTTVRILDLQPMKDRTTWWEWSMTLIEAAVASVGAPDAGMTTITADPTSLEVTP